MAVAPSCGCQSTETQLHLRQGHSQRGGALGRGPQPRESQARDQLEEEDKAQAIIIRSDGKCPKRWQDTVVACEQHFPQAGGLGELPRRDV